MRFKPPALLRGRKVRSLLAAGAVLAVVAGGTLALAAPASADPQVGLVAVGSSTTQALFDAFTNGAAPPLAPGLLGSYDATNLRTGANHEIITPVDGSAGTTCSFARPKNSVEGVGALRVALNANSTLGGRAAAPPPQLGCVDIARSVSGVDVAGNNPAVDVQWVPFAVDGVAGAIGPASCSVPANCPTFTADLGNGSTMNVTTVASTLGPAIGDLTLAQVSALYNCNAVVVTVNSTTTTYWPTGSPTAQPSGSVAVDLYVPPPGTGLRSFWESVPVADFPDSEVGTACVHDHIINGALAPANTGGVSVPVQENDGTAVATDPIGYTPYSVGDYVGQLLSSQVPQSYGAQLPGIGGVSPFVIPGTITSGLDVNFPVLRYVYNVVKLSRLTTPNNPVNTLFNGVGSTICKQKGLIQKYGFALMSASVFTGLTCGTIIPGLEGAP
jgi:hypothetical protein